MGDDPYDFDIAIPSGKAAAGTKGKTPGWAGGRRGRPDDRDASESSGGGGSESGGGSDISLSDSEDFREKRKTVGASKAPVTRGGGGTGGGGGGGGSSALDKAKSFLSKYSTKPMASSSATATKAASSARSRRLEMSLDDEDFSLDSSGEEIQKPKMNKDTPSKERVTRKQSSESEQDGDEDKDEESYTKPTPVPAVAKSRFEDSDDDVDDRPQPVASRVDAKPSTAPVASRYDSDDGESDAPAPVRAATFAAGYGASQTKRVVHNGDDDDVESIASQSEMDLSVDVPKPTSNATKAQPTPVAAPDVTAKPRQISAMSESGVYEEEDFEDDSLQATAAHLKNAEPAKTTVATSRPREEESNFDYSLDFAEDLESASLPVPVSSAVATTVIREEEHDEREERRSRSASSSSSVSNRNSYVDDGDDDEEDYVPRYQEDSQQEESGIENPTVLAANTVATEAHASTLLQDSQNYSQDYGFELASVVITSPRAEDAPKSAESRVPDSTADKYPTNDPPSKASAHQTTIVFQNQAQQQPALVKVPPTQTRPRVVIVREYETNASNVEKRDASTQFTGNHAGIQTDLIPDGMFTSAERNDPASCSPVDHQHPPDLPQYPTLANSSVTAPTPPHSQSLPNMPGPPPSPFATYGLYDPLQLPVATSMSIYKQQLMALQQQIQQKKLETERLFRDRMATRYSSLRGTDKFLAANRPTRIPLWEALLRVDPTLDERRAKEIASLAGNAAQ